ncbi:HIRAN domain-containing protein [Bradyrhizobium sp. 521_C7_N1_3]|uniref:HIRAN domain-containing protein n=1 Tax=Bradyrhizobium sp. 521_C7_N1_3 TaxID=3240368 RepID=UPI003F8C9506
MENWIRKAPQPSQLFLAWQAPDQFGDRFRWAIGVLRRDGSDFAFRYLKEGPEFEAANQGRTLSEIRSLGYDGYPAFKIRDEVYKGDIGSVFMRRLPPRTRSDFGEYKQQFRLAPEVMLSDFSLLGVTEAKLPSDGFSLVDPLDAGETECELMLEIAGFRYYVADLPRRPNIGDVVTIAAEPESKFDPNAVKVCLDGRKIGNINRLQCQTFLRWLPDRRVSAVIERLNGSATKPRAFIFTRIRPKASSIAA